MKELEGKIINVQNHYSTNRGRVVGCDYDIGITIVAENDPNQYLYCLIGESSTLWKESFLIGKEKYAIIFDDAISKIKSGFLSVYEIIGRAQGGASAETCPFGQ